MAIYYDEDKAIILFQIAYDIAVKRAGGICELCHSASATKVHRIVDLVWGAFDTPSNLLIVCEACHRNESQAQ